MQGVATALRVVVGELACIPLVEKQAPVGAAGRLVGVVVDSQEDPAPRWQSQRLQEQGKLLLAGGALDKLSDLGAYETDLVAQAPEKLGSEILKGETDDLVVEPVRANQQGHV